MTIAQLINAGVLAPGSTHWEVKVPTDALIMLQTIFKSEQHVHRETVCSIIDRGIKATAPVSFAPAMPPLPSTSGQRFTPREAMDMFSAQSNTPWRTSLPCEWVSSVCMHTDWTTVELTTVQQRAHQLLEAAIAYEAKLSSYQTRGEPTDELKALRELITPLRPPTLEEALDALRAFANQEPTVYDWENAKNLIARIK